MFWKAIVAILVGVSLVLIHSSSTRAQLPLRPPASAAPSDVACDKYAWSYAQQASRHGQLLGGAAAGSLIGLGLGALAAASGVGAAIGATVGLLGGGRRRQQRAQEIYQAAYKDCLAGRRP